MIRVLIVDDFRLMANLISSVLEEEKDIEVIGCSHLFEDALKLIDKKQVDVILLNIKMGKENALVLTRQLDKASGESNLIVYGVTDKKEHILPFIEAGADGVIKEKDRTKDLVNSIRLAYKGKARLSPEITRSLIDRLSQLSQVSTNLSNENLPIEDLTPRELEVLKCLGKDMTNKEIAEKLFIEVGTVKNHVHNILEKLDVNTRGEASQYLMFAGRSSSD